MIDLATYALVDTIIGAQTRDELNTIENELRVISTKLLAGRTVVHVYDDSSPGAGFETVEPDMKDVYFSVMARHHGQRVAELQA